MSRQFYWEIIKDNSSYLVRDCGGRVFSREPRNIAGINECKWNGLLEGNTVNMYLNSDGNIQTDLRVGKENRTITFSGDNIDAFVLELKQEVSECRPEVVEACVRRFHRLNSVRMRQNSRGEELQEN